VAVASDAVPRLVRNAGSPLQVRVGITTGLVVVGDPIGEGAAQEQAVVGETPNLAARLQGLAEPGTVVIAASTQRLTGGLFEYRNLGAVSLKGFAENVRAWQVLGTGPAESRFEDFAAAGPGYAAAKPCIFGSTAATAPAGAGFATANRVLGSVTVRF
jgi:class 3 adenylate cyclase